MIWLILLLLPHRASAVGAPFARDLVRLERLAERASGHGRDLKIYAAARTTDGARSVEAARRSLREAEAGVRRTAEYQSTLLERAASLGLPDNEDFDHAHAVTRATEHFTLDLTRSRDVTSILARERAFHESRRRAHRAWRLPRVIHRLRAYPEILMAPEVQRALRDLVGDRIATLAVRTAWLTGHARGWGIEVPNLARRWPNFRSRNFNPILLDAVLTELESNARRASAANACAHGLETPATAASRRADGRFVFTIEDFGRAEEFERTTGLGVSGESAAGVGIGRFTAYLIAAFLGYEIAHEAKPGGSGSIVRVILPHEHGL